MESVDVLVSEDMNVTAHITNANIVTDAFGEWPSFWESYVEEARCDYRGQHDLTPPVLDLVVFPTWQTETPGFTGTLMTIELRFQNVTLDKCDFRSQRFDDLKIECIADRNWNPPRLHVELEGLASFDCSAVEIINLSERRPDQE